MAPKSSNSTLGIAKWHTYTKISRNVYSSPGRLFPKAVWVFVSSTKWRAVSSYFTLHTQTLKLSWCKRSAQLLSLRWFPSCWNTDCQHLTDEHWWLKAVLKTLQNQHLMNINDCVAVHRCLDVSIWEKVNVWLKHNYIMCTFLIVRFPKPAVFRWHWPTFQVEYCLKLLH